MSKKNKQKHKRNYPPQPESPERSQGRGPGPAGSYGGGNRVFLWFIFIGSIVGSMVVLGLLRMPPSQAPVYTYEVIGTYPHDPAAFTQGLLLENGKLYESTGRLKQSSVRIVNLETGKPLVKKDLPDVYFGEGIAVFGSKLYQLTYQNNRILVYDKDTLEKLEEREFPFNGWGLTSDSDYLIHSDGTSAIRYIDPETLQVVNKVTVHDGRNKISEINELEYYDGRIYANVWHENYILQIVPATGRVSARIDLAGLLDPPSSDPEACLNGIAIDPDSNTLLVTGKLWPKLFRIKIVESE